MLPPILVGHSRLPQTSPQPILHLIHLVGDDSFVCYSSSVDRYGSVVWSLSSPFFWGCDAIVSLTPPPPPINYLPPSASIFCRPCSFLLPDTYHLPFICSPPPSILPEAIFGPYPLPRYCCTTWDCPKEVPMMGGSHTSFYWSPFPLHREC